MIASVAGVVGAVAPNGAVVEVAGVGLLVQCGPATLATLRVGEAARLFTSLVVREDALTLYGFLSDDERSIFELLQTASGVGPRLAQAILAVHSPRGVRRAVVNGDVSALTQVSGVGKKGAERLILELKDRIGQIDDSDSTSGEAAQSSSADWLEPVRQGLVSLGWSRREAEQVTMEIAATCDDTSMSVSRALKQAIAMLSAVR